MKLCGIGKHAWRYTSKNTRVCPNCERKEQKFLLIDGTHGFQRVDKFIPWDYDKRNPPTNREHFCWNCGRQVIDPPAISPSSNLICRGCARSGDVAGVQVDNDVPIELGSPFKPSESTRTSVDEGSARIQVSEPERIATESERTRTNADDPKKDESLRHTYDESGSAHPISYRNEQQKMVSTQRNNVVIGIGLAILALGFVLIVAPYVTTLGSTVIFNETFVVPARERYWVGWNFTGDLPLHISFNVEYGGDRKIEFYAVSQANLEKMIAGESFSYYETPYRSYLSRLELDWVPRPNVTTFFIWSNVYSAEPRTVSAHFSFRPLMPFFTFSGVILLFSGLSTSAYGHHPPSPNSSRVTIIAGYIFATLGGFIGLLLAAIIHNSGNAEAKKHGTKIFVIGALSTITYAFLVLL